MITPFTQLVEVDSVALRTIFISFDDMSRHGFIYPIKFGGLINLRARLVLHRFRSPYLA